MVHGRHVTFLDDAVLFGELGFGEGLSNASAIFPCSRGSLHVSKRVKSSYGLVGGVTDLLAHQLVHPVVGLVVLARVVREAGDDERHVGGCCWVVVVFVRWPSCGMSLVQLNGVEEDEGGSSKCSSTVSRWSHGCM